MPTFNIQHLISKKNRAVSVLLVLFIIATFMGISIVVASFTTRELKFAEVNEYSEIAYYAAEAGVERGMYVAKKCPTLDEINCSGDCYWDTTCKPKSEICCSDYSGDCVYKSGICPNPTGETPNKTYFKVTIIPGGTGDCSATNYCVDSTGQYSGATPEVVRTKSRQY